MNALELFSLKDYVCVVTGVAAPKGLGMAMCRALGDAGAKLVISDITENVHSAADTLREAGYQVAETVADTTTIEGAEKVRDTALNAYGKIDVLVNNAAIGYTCAAEEMPFKEGFMRIIDNNIGGYFVMAQVIGKEMIKEGKGSIINISSKSGFLPDTPNKQTSYNVSKSGINMLTQSLAVEWAPFNIRVNSIAPGNMITKPVEDGLWDHCVDAWKARNPMHRFGRPDELSGAVIFLAGEASSYVTGSTVHVDGGYTCY